MGRAMPKAVKTQKKSYSKARRQNTIVPTTSTLQYQQCIQIG